MSLTQRFADMSVGRRCTVAAALLAILIAGWFVTTTVSGLNSEGKPTKAFDREVWIQWSCCTDTSRLEMVSSVTRITAGVTADEVIRLLGPSEVPDQDLHLFVGCGECLVYRLGLEPGMFRIDPNHLVLRIKEGRVTSAFVQ